MTRSEYFLWLMSQALSGLRAFRVITLLLIVAVILVTAWSFRSRASTRRLRLLPLILITPVAILGLGTLFERSDRLPLEHLPWPVYAVYGLLVVHVVAAVIMIVKLRGLRWAAASWSALSLWCSLWAGFVSIMSITNDWI